jgi:hypothetical protein
MRYMSMMEGLREHMEENSVSYALEKYQGKLIMFA